MKMTAAAGDGDDVQVRTKESIEQDFGDGNDSSCYFCESLIFPVFCGCSRVQNLKLQRGAMDCVQGFQGACYPQDTMGVLKLKSYTFRRGGVWKYEHVQWTPCRFSPPGDASGAKGGVAVHRGDAKWSCPD